MENGNAYDWDDFSNDMKAWYESIDFGAIFSAPFFVPLLAVLVGAGASIGGSWVMARSHRLNKKAEFLQEWKREEFNDIRAFQEIIIDALEAVESEVAYFMSTDTGVITKEKWEPVKIEELQRRGQMLSSRIEDKKIIDRWRKFNSAADGTVESIRKCIKEQQQYDEIDDEQKSFYTYRLESMKRDKNKVPDSLQKVRDSVGDDMVKEFSRVLRDLKGS